MTKKKFDVLKDIVNNTSKSSNKPITILPELKSFILPLTIEEYARLEDSIIKEGCRDKIVVWEREKDLVIVDGYNRYDICTKNNIQFEIDPKEFQNIEDVQDWMINNQLGRRNLTPELKSYYRGLQYHREKSKHGGKRQASSQNENLKTSERLAELYKVSKNTILRDEEFALGVDKLAANHPEIKKKILMREVDINLGTIRKMAKEQDDKEIETLINFILEHSEEEERKIEKKEYIDRELNKYRKELIEIINKYLKEKDIDALKKSFLNYLKTIEKKFDS